MAAWEDPNDVRTVRMDLECPICRRIHRAHTTNVATDVIVYRCKRKDCRTKWQVIVKPLKVNAQMAIRQTDWLEIKEGR